MKRIIALVMVICVIFCACGSTRTEETTNGENTPVTEDGFYRNPLNGEKMTEAYNGRVFAVTINNVSPALPHRGVGDADVFFEMFINDYCTRGLALFSDVRSVASIGSIRSTRYNFTDIALAYNTVVIHANASQQVLDDMNSSGVDNILADIPVGYRDSARSAAGYAYEHTLFATGENIYNAAANKGFNLSVSDKNYGMNFEDEATPANGSDAQEIEIVFTHDGIKKTTVMKYNSETDAYAYNQYSKAMVDENTGAAEEFKNVIVILAPTSNLGVYHVADLSGSGDGFFACGGKIIPIKWSHANETDPFTFTLTDGTALAQEAGSTYIAIAPTGSAVNY